MSGIALQMKLTALPGHAGETCFARGTQAGMVIADDQYHAVQATALQAFHESAPVHLRLAQRHADAQNAALAVLAHAHRDQHRAGNHRAAVAHLLIAGIEEDVWKSTQRPISPT